MMIDISWLRSAMLGDSLVVRLHITPGENTRVKAEVYSYWNDDAYYNYYSVGYRFYEEDEGRLQPLRFRWLPPNPADWDHDLITRDWPLQWHESQPAVFTVGTIKRASEMPDHHPQIIAHLARFQTMVELARPEVPGRGTGGWDISRDIVSRRLNGMVRARLRDWRRIIGPMG